MIFFLFDDKTEPADIFAEIPSEKTEPKTQSAGTTPLPVGESGVIMQQAHFGKKGVIILIVIVVLLGGGAAAFFLSRGPSAPEPIAPIVETPAPQPEPQPEPAPQPEPEPAVETPVTPPITDADTDGDGLGDSREAQLGTNANLVDSDADDLSDREEVEVYQTNPVLSDTDGDTFKDGDEVRNGYDPKGPGKLQQIPSVP